ncbi:hypothetical protein V8E54_003411 [Elaphomyces granulatus]
MASLLVPSQYNTRLQTHLVLLFSYPKLRGASKSQSFQPYSRSGSRTNGFEDFGSDSDVFEQTAPIQHRANELFCFESKDDQVEAIQHLLCDRNQILIVETGFILFQAAPRSIIQEESKRASLIIMPLNLEEEQAEKLKRMAAWQLCSTAIQTRERTAMRSVQLVSTIHTDSMKSTLNLWYISSVPNNRLN